MAAARPRRHSWSATEPWPARDAEVSEECRWPSSPGDALLAASSSAVRKPGAIEAAVPAMYWWWSMPSSRIQLCWPKVSAIAQPSSTSSGSEKFACSRAQKPSSSAGMPQAMASA